MAYDDYAPVASPDDEEEDKRRDDNDYPPVSSPTVAPSITAAVRPDSVIAPDPGAPPAVGLPSTKGDDLNSALAVGSPMPTKAMSPAQTRLKSLTDQGAPPVQPAHGWKKALNIIGDLAVPSLMSQLRGGAQRDYETNLKDAEGDVTAENQPAVDEAELRQKNALAGQEEAKAQALKNPPPKAAGPVTWKAIPGMTDAKGRVLQESSDGQLRWGQGIEGVAPLKSPTDKPDNPEQQFVDEYQKTHPGSSIADAQRAFKQNEHITDPTDKNNARSDRSYQFHAGRIDKLRTPIEQKMERISRLEDTLDQGTPQADALVAPELLSVMAGGQGSGLRMNEAEIARIVGGRDKWQDLKAKLDAYRLDPNKGFAITPEQRQQVRALFDAVKERTSKKLSIIDEESGNLINTDDAHEHRKIFNRLQQRLNTADSERKEKEPERPANVPDGYVYQENGPKGKGWYKPSEKK